MKITQYKPVKAVIFDMDGTILGLYSIWSVKVIKSNQLCKSFH